MATDESNGSTHGRGQSSAASGPSEHWRLSRRELMVGGAAATAVYLVESSGAVRAAGPLAGALTGNPQRPGSIVQWMRRREDGLLLRFEFVNMRRVAGQGQVTRRNNIRPAYLVVVMPPQHVLEQAFFEPEPNLGPLPTPPEEPLGSRPVGARLAGESRLAFELPPEAATIDLNATELLGWVRWRMSVVDAAQPRGRRVNASLRLTEPTLDQTTIELPWWLILSPHEKSTWAHSIAPVEHDGRTELWHTRLAARDTDGTDPLVDEADDDARSVRAVWARDDDFDWRVKFRQLPVANPTPPAAPDGASFPEPGLPFRAPLTPRDRFDIVWSSADYIGHDAGPTYTPAPIDVRRLMLTSMGAWIDSQGQWDPDETDTSLEDWTQRGTHGRDHYVRIIRAGNFAAFGHRCSLIKITERKFDEAPDGPGNTAYLRQRLFIVRRERFRFFGGNEFQPVGGRRFPFSKVELVTAITPNLDVPEPFSPAFGSESTRLFMPKVGGAPFKFHLRLTDLAGRVHDIAVPLVFVDLDLSKDASAMNDLIDDFNDQTPFEPMKEVLSHEFRERIALAEPTAPGGDDTTLDVRTMTWGMETPTVGPGQAADFAPWFLPTMAHADVRFAAAEVASGAGVGGANVVLDPDYAQGGFGAVPGGIFVNLSDPSTPVEVGYGSKGNGDRSGGAIEPAVAITAVSRRNGVVAGQQLSTLRAGSFDPADFFGLAGAKLLGSISLADVIALSTGKLDDAPALDSRIVRDPNGTPTASETTLDWDSLLKPVSPPGATNLFAPMRSDPNRTPDLMLHSRVVDHFSDPSKSTSRVVAELRDFEVNLFGDASSPAGFIGIDFNRLRFTSIDGAKPSVDVDIERVDFRDPLKFINKLDPYLRSAGLGGLFVDVAPTNVTIGYSLALPSIEVGVFSIQNIAVNAGVTIPFTGEPVRLRFGFCTREDPFILTVLCFGGGGFVGLAIGADGIEMVEAALEARAQLALDVGVASGSVSAALGLYFKVESKSDGSESVELTGYTRLAGKLRIMGIVGLSVEFYLAFTYDVVNDKVWGQASVTVEVEVLMFSGSVTMEVERRYGGSNDPTFGEMMTEGDWNDYVTAFAA